MECTARDIKLTHFLVICVVLMEQVPDPWERAAVEDGTWAADADRAEMAGEDGVAVAQSVEGLNAFRADAVSKQAKAMVASSADD